jgi:hypothetical protein
MRVTRSEMPSKEVTAPETVQEVSTLGQSLRGLIEAVPQSSTEDAQYRIVQQILAARDLSELDAPWSGGADSLGKYNDTTITIHSIRRAPSSFQGGPGIFLILDVESEGEHYVVTTGSVSVVVQLLKAFELNAFPVSCTPKISKRQTARGYWPQHLEFNSPAAA